MRCKFMPSRLAPDIDSRTNLTCVAAEPTDANWGPQQPTRSKSQTGRRQFGHDWLGVLEQVSRAGRFAATPARRFGRFWVLRFVDRALFFGTLRYSCPVGSFPRPL